MTKTKNDLQMKREAEEITLHRMAKVYEFLEMWQGSQNLCATQKESHTQNKQMTAVGNTSDTEEIINASWSNYQHDGKAAFELLERSPLPPALSAKDLPRRRTQVLDVRWTNRLDCHLAESDKDSTLETSLVTENWLYWNGVLDNPNQSKDDWKADDEPDIELDYGNGDLDIPE